MCGIVGTIHYKDKEILDRMNDSQIHRGPDEGGMYWDQQKEIGLAMRRLSIVDLTNGHQPMMNEDASIIMVYNGEIFNANDLRKSLIAKGHIFKTHNSDTEVLVHLYEEYGVDMLNRLNGMFAFAIYDHKKNVMFIARDQMGIKPLFYIASENRIAFASEVKSLVAGGISKKRLDMESLWQYMSWQCIPAPLTVYEDIKALPAAHYMLYNINDNTTKIARYWDCIENRKLYEGTREELNEYVADQVEQAIERWTMSDVPLACSLSGGLDSSIIAAIISKKHPLYTYTLGWEDGFQEDERSLGKKLADMYGTIHEGIVVTPKDLLADLDKMLFSMDGPYGGGVPTWFIMKQVSGRQKVIFNGLGGDELFGNYYKWLRYENPAARMNYYLRALNYGENFTQFLKYPSGSIYNKYMSEQMKADILKTDADSHENTSAQVEKLIRQCPAKRWRDRVPYIDFRIQLPEEFLMMVDRFSMHYSIEARTPFLDRELVERILGVPGKYRTRTVGAKYLLKNSLGHLLPEEYLKTPKRGFVLPYKEWLLGDLKEEVIELCTGNYIRQQGIFNENLEKKLIDPFYKGNDGLTQLVWTVYMFQRWIRAEE